MPDSSEPPIKEFRAGLIQASIWSQTVKRNDRTWKEHSVRVLKRYKDDRTGKWRVTTYFRTEDLPKLALVAGKAFEFLTLREGRGPSESPVAPKSEPPSST